MNCPVCGHHYIGQIGRSRFYCQECCHEWIQTDTKVKVYKISLDGKLINARLSRLNKSCCAYGQ